MLQNNGSYNGHSDVNMGAPLNMTHVNNTNAINNINKIPNIPQRCDRPEIPPPNQMPLNMSASMQPFVDFVSHNFPYPKLPDQHFAAHSNPNGVMPMNLNLHSRDNTMPGYDHLAAMIEAQNISNPFKPDARKMPINIPEFPVRHQPRDYTHEMNPTYNYHYYDKRNRVQNLTLVSEEVMNLKDLRSATLESRSVPDSSDQNSNIPGPSNEIKYTPKKLRERSRVISLIEEIDTWTDTEFLFPFVKDCAVYKREDGDESYDATESVEIAQSWLKGPLDKTPKLFKCEHCQQYFRNPKRFLIHYKWHTFGRLLEKRQRQQLEREEKKKERRKQLDQQREADTETEFACNQCDKNFTSRQNLKWHKAKEHQPQPRDCKVCGRRCDTAGALRQHTLAEHTTEAAAAAAADTAKFICDGCPKTFKFLHSLQRHQATHKEKIFGCQSCDKKFGSQLLLNIHSRTHDKVLKGVSFHCTYCGKGFYHSYNLQVHERIHRNERPFKCDICQSSYGTNSGLQRHLKVSHSSSKPHVCAVCRRSFTTEKALSRHLAASHADPRSLRHACALCPARFPRANALHKHTARAHRPLHDVAATATATAGTGAAKRTRHPVAHAAHAALADAAATSDCEPAPAPAPAPAPST